MKKSVHEKAGVVKSVLVAVQEPFQPKEEVIEYLEELDWLSKTAGTHPVHRFIQKLTRPNPRTFIGSGKVEEIKTFIENNTVDLIIFDDELSPAQMRNLERILDRRILDRTNLILDIFASRAKTAQARTQVALAQYQYLLPRLTGLWTHLERQRGGIGLRGPGEREIETDRRIVRERIAKLKKDLSKIDKRMALQRKNREKLVRVVLVGYTNVGKSTLMNILGKADVLEENKLFATLDTTVRKVVIENLSFLLSDTVGFIRKLPPHLIESFKSTLDEVREADLLLHVVDISHVYFEEQINTVNHTLQELGANNIPEILVFNKMDAYHYEPKDPDDLSPVLPENISLASLKKTWMNKNKSFPVVFISAKNRQNLEELKDLMYQKIRDIHVKRYPYNDFLY